MGMTTKWQTREAHQPLGLVRSGKPKLVVLLGFPALSSGKLSMEDSGAGFALNSLNPKETLSSNGTSLDFAGLCEIVDSPRKWDKGAARHSSTVSTAGNSE